ncbi:ectoine hydroxylase [Alicyclobacillus cycloheptanicus]|uniref:Ectoine hydroxylase n=1 Tax=Alicyclobacillus cycloheptanicus TaxID=1457 RepID=A0ABT9XHG3_9BACL|nr:ectoine hydroxylase [Alicyclobacillus cycloheptanicus]MDQ0189749.1 ectoine hydroxylase [Alicyclobacillus cycloheptanicus]
MQQTIVPDVYPSRVHDRPSIEARKDPVVYRSNGLAADGPLTADQLAQYERDGFLMLENLFTQTEVEQMRAEMARVLEENEGSHSQAVIREPESEEVRSVFAIHETDTAFNRISRDSRLLDRARQLLDSEVYVHQSRINFKPGFEGKEFYWHSDFETWHVEDGMPRMRAVSFSILLDDNLPFNGSLMLVPGSHKHFISCVGKTPEDHYKQSLRRQEVGVPDRGSLTWLVDRYGLQMPSAKAGSVLMFECNTMHGSNSNITPLPRRNVFVVYNSVENALQPPYSGGKPRPGFVAARKPELVVR